MNFVFVLYSIWRIATFIISYFAQRFIPYLGSFPYKELLIEFHIPSWMSAFANFDGLHYALIAQGGYYQNDQAFFPLYPILIRLFSYLLPIQNAFFAPRNSVLAGIIISSVFFLLGLIVFYKLLKLLFAKEIKNVKWTLLFLVLFPTSFYFGAMYTESLFFFLTVSSLFFLFKKKYGVAGLFAALASSTRLVGIFLFIPFIAQLIQDKYIILKKYPFTFSWKSLYAICPFIGFLLYSLYLGVVYKDPLFFINAQKAFNANRSTHPILLPQVYYRYFKILFTAAHDFQWYLSLFEMSIFSFVLLVVILNLFQDLKNKEMPKQVRHDLIGLNLFSLINLILPTLTGTFSSIPRYALFSFSFFLYLGNIKSNVIKVVIATLFGIFQVVLLGLFIQGYFVG